MNLSKSTKAWILIISYVFFIVAVYYDITGFKIVFGLFYGCLLLSTLYDRKNDVS